MRQGFIAAALLAAGLFTFSPLQAATTASAGPKVGVVDLQAVMGNSQRGRLAGGSLKDLQNNLQSQVDDRNKKVLAIKEQLDKADSKSVDYQKLLKNYQDAQNDFQQFVTESRQDLAERQQELIKPIQDELLTVLGQYAKSNHFDIILQKGSGAVFSSDAYDITTAVTLALDKDWADLQKNQPATPAPAAATKH